MNTPHSITSDAQGNIYVGDRGNARVQVFDNDLDPARHLRQRRQPVGGLRLAGRRTSTCSCRTRTRTATRRRRGPSPARSTRWSWTARSSASSARPARGSASSAPSTRSTAATPNELFVVGDLGLARAEDHPQPEAGADHGRRSSRRRRIMKRSFRLLVRRRARARPRRVLSAQLSIPEIPFDSRRAIC